jgi:hypothetical protein
MAKYKRKDINNIEGRKTHFTDISRMSDDGLGGGYVTDKNENALIGETITPEPEEAPPTVNGKIVE